MGRETFCTRLKHSSVYWSPIKVYHVEPKKSSTSELLSGDSDEYGYAVRNGPRNRLTPLSDVVKRDSDLSLQHSNAGDLWERFETAFTDQTVLAVPELWEKFSDGQRSHQR